MGLGVGFELCVCVCVGGVGCVVQRVAARKACAAPASAPGAAYREPNVRAACDPSPSLQQTRGASPGTKAMVLETLDAAARMGFTVIRAWAFNDGAGWNALQTAPGEGSGRGPCEGRGDREGARGCCVAKGRRRNVLRSASRGRCCHSPHSSPLTPGGLILFQ